MKDYIEDIKDNDVIVKSLSFDEEFEVITNGPVKVLLTQKNFMISIIINIVVKNGFSVDMMLEETVMKDAQ